jgi:hypothetical protein
MLSEALLRNFQSNVISDVYELDFEKLRVNFIQGNISVYSIVLKPRKTPLKIYPEINSSIRFHASKMQLVNVHIFELLRQNKLNLEKIEIANPEMQLKLSGKVPIIFPTRDSLNIKKNSGSKKFIEQFVLSEFKLKNASIKIFNSFKQRDISLSDFNILINDLELSQKSNKNNISVRQLEILIGEFKGRILDGPVKQISFSDYKFRVDSLLISRSIDTVIYKFYDFNFGLSKLDVHTADSIFNLKVQNFDLAYRNNSLKFAGVEYKPNLSRDAIQKMQKYQNTQFSVKMDSLSFKNLIFDSLIYYRKILIDNIEIENLTASIFKNNAKILDTSKFPKYLGQMVNAIPLPINIRSVKLSNANLEYDELKPDHVLAKAHVNRATVTAENITNISNEKPLVIVANAYLENKVQTDLKLAFSYTKPEFSINGLFKKFNLTDLNPLIHSFTPAKVKKGIVDEISYSGTVFNSYSAGTMKFLYHDLEIDLDLENKAQWKSTLGAFAANAYLHSRNPVSSDLPPRIVKFRAERMMNRGFINIIVKSALAGLKETMIMSKENRKEYHKSVKKAKGKGK